MRKLPIGGEECIEGKASSIFVLYISIRRVVLKIALLSRAALSPGRTKF